MLFRERQIQIPQTAATQALHKDSSEIKTDKPEEQSLLMHESSTTDEKQPNATDPTSNNEPMETQPAADGVVAETDDKQVTSHSHGSHVSSNAESDDEQPKSKLASHPHGSHTSSNQPSILTNQTAASTIVGGASSDEDLPYFPAHPISYFPEEVESSASAAARQPPQVGPRSIFDREVSLYAISEDEPSLMPTLESFQVGVTVLAV